MCSMSIASHPRDLTGAHLGFEGSAALFNKITFAFRITHRRELVLGGRCGRRLVGVRRERDIMLFGRYRGSATAISAVSAVSLGRRRLRDRPVIKKEVVEQDQRAKEACKECH